MTLQVGGILFQVPRLKRRRKTLVEMKKMEIFGSKAELSHPTRLPRTLFC